MIEKRAMNIGILAVDSNFPNLALMKISSYHKARGDNVEWYNPFVLMIRFTLQKYLALRWITAITSMPIKSRKAVQDMT